MQTALEQHFPHIVNHLVDVWSQGDEALRYLDNLLFTERQRTDRHGFQENAWIELTFLNELLRLECPPAPSDLATDIWAIAFESGSERTASSTS